MRVQKLDLVDDRIVTTSDILQIGPIAEKISVPGSENDEQPVVIAFDIGDMDNAGNWQTYGPVILARRAKSLRISTGNANIQAPLATEKRDLRQIITVVLARPILIITEPIVACTDLFLALEYAVFFLYFEAYPIIFKGIYGFSDGYAALAFIPSKYLFRSIVMNNVLSVIQLALEVPKQC
ncbi:hypothetical protein OEA41_007533 [Lepraria neglecta]|uniref:Uncharacterized protein n=1 Tax=Lepraria neglecta TaxID=209136 RepID=A0AAD9ZDS3_9LECA|nr:hypothetical protein OEA41_007533 [Lepraria neglecta]